MTLEIDDKKNIFRDPIGFDPTKPLTKDILLDTELDEIKESGEHDPESTAFRIVEHLVLKNKVIEKDEIREHLNSWQRFRRYKWDLLQIKKIIDSVWNNKRIFNEIKQIAFEHGHNYNQLIFDKDQTIETAFWLMGRYNIKRVEITGDLIFFNGKRYEKDAEELIKRNARDCLIKSSNADMKEIIGLIQDKSPIIKSKDVEKFIHLCCLFNGVYNVKTGKYVETFNPDDIILDENPHSWNEDATFKGINQKVSEIIPNEHDRQSFYDFLSICYLQFNGIDFQFGGVGQPGTGKTQLCKLMELVLGSDNVSHAPIHLIAKDQTTQKDIAFKRLNIDPDLSPEDIKQVDVMKKWITQDPFTGRSIYSHSSTFRPIARLSFMANELYEIPNNDDSQAIYERTHLIKIDRKFRTTKDEIKNIFEKVATNEELDGFITYLLKNATKIYENQKIEYPIDVSIVSSIWNQHGNRIRNFIDKWIDKDPTFKTQKPDVWNKWLSIALKNKFPAKHKIKFYETFEEIIGISSLKIRLDKDVTIWGYQGLRIKSDEEVKKEEQESLDHA